MTSRSSRSRAAGVLGILVLLLACGIVMGVYWGVGPSWRCFHPDTGAPEPGWSARAVLSGNRERCYHLYVPPGHDPSRSGPVVFSFHGFLSNPESQALISGWHDLADQAGFLVVYPQGTSFPQRWNSSGSWGADAIDDVQFFRDILDDLPSVVDVDRSRVYVNGFSNGGGMAVRIGCEASDVVAAIGSVAGAVVDTGTCQPSRPVPVMVFHGTADPVVGYYGDMPFPGLHYGADLTRAPSRFLGAEEWTAGWAAGNGCDPSPVTLPPSGDVHGVRYTGCASDAGVEFYTIDGGGHTWPGGWPIPVVVGKTSKDIDATQELWDFFQDYVLAVP